MNVLKRKEAIAKIESRCSSMSSETKNFIQKICYRKSASIDMTQYGFIRDCKVRPINLMVKPLQEQLERICGNTNNSLAMNARKIPPPRRNEKGGSTNKPRKASSAKSPKRPVNHKNNHILELIKSNVREKRKV